MDGSNLDQEFLEELLDGDKEFAAELFETYFESADAALAEAKKMLSSDDQSQTFRSFHTLKGASASVGLTGVQELSRELEHLAKLGDYQKCTDGIPRLEAAVEQGKNTLNTYLDSLP